MLSYKWDEFIFWAVPFVLTGRAAVKAGEGTAGGPALRTARDRGEERQSCTRVWTQTKSLPLPSVSNSLAKRLRDEPAGCNAVEQMYSNERCLAAPRALYTRPSPPALTTSCLAAPRCPDLASNSQRCCTGHWDTQRRAHSSALLYCSRPSCYEMFTKVSPVSPCWNETGKSPGCCLCHLGCWWSCGVFPAFIVCLSMKVSDCPFHFRPIKSFAKSSGNFIPVSLVEKINCIKQGD